MITCRVCSKNNLELALDLGNQPWANNFLKYSKIGSEQNYPLQLVVCSDCLTAQINFTVPKEIMFTEHTYLSGTTATLKNHFIELADTIITRYFNNPKLCNVLDIGSNDGTQLNAYRAKGAEVLGIESCKPVSEIAINNGIPTINRFFNEETAKLLNKKFDIINASGVFFHLEELHSVAAGVKSSLKDDGVFVVQCIYVKSMMDNLAFDQIYHEHLLYYSLQSLSFLLELHGLEPFDGWISPIHGGSLILLCGHKNKRPKSENLKRIKTEEDKGNTNTIERYYKFGADVQKLAPSIREGLLSRRQKGLKIFGMGAPVKGNTLLNYCKIDNSILECLVERNDLRKDLWSPGMHIPIKLEDEVGVPDVYFVLAWNFKNEILKRYSKLIDSGVEFIFPIDPK